jgi:hypothetical protein
MIERIGALSEAQQLALGVQQSKQSKNNPRLAYRSTGSDRSHIRSECSTPTCARADDALVSVTEVRAAKRLSG